MTREEKLHIAEQIKDYLCEGNPIWDVGTIAEAMDAAIEAIKFRGAYEIAVKAANKAFENRWTQWVEWIPCSERLPDSNGEYLVTTKDGEVYQDTFQFLCQWDDNKDNVIAWMPLPQPMRLESDL